jgi:hypothetical protein
MTTGYRGAATTPDLDYHALERRVAHLERELDRRERKAGERRMWLWYYGYSPLIGVLLALIVYLAGLD